VIKGLIYSRVSTEDQAKKGQSIEAQIRLCSAFAKNNNIQVVEIFKDEGKSASTTNRPGLRALLEKATNGSGVNCILVMDTDRMARNTLDHLSIKALLKKHDVKLISVSQPMIDDSPEGNFIDTVLASANALQSQITGRKTSKVMEQKIKAGWWANQAPLGYINTDNPKPNSTLDKRIIIPDPDRAPLITQMFKHYATSTYSLETLTVKMTKLGFTSKNGQPLQISVAHRILSSPLYYGKIPWKGQLYPGNHQPLIDKDTWLLCQDVLDNHNQHASRTRKHNYLLRGVSLLR
jgi:site-specific DNA recombinase